MMSSSAAIAPGLTGDTATRLQQIIVGWRGADRGEPLSALHTQCRDAAGPGGGALVPDRLVLVARLDEATLRAALGRPVGPHRIAHVDFRVPIAGRFDAALVPAAHPGQAPDRWIVAIDDALSLHDQVALYAHALGHLLLNREVTQMGRIAPLDPSDGYTHVDTLAGSHS